MSRSTIIRDRFKNASLLFGLFFGAGNLIFPVAIGQQAGLAMPIAGLGFIVSAVGLASFGIIATAHSNKSSLESMLEPYGKGYARFFTLLLMLTIGPLFALPRTATVPYEVTVPTLYPLINHQLGLFIYSFVFFGLALVIALKPTKVEQWIAYIINPLFLTLLIIFIIYAFLNPLGKISVVDSSILYQSQPLLMGFQEGYQTMDLLAALSFGFIVNRSINKNQEKKYNSKKELIIASLLAGILMSIIYISLSYLGASSLNIFSPSSNGGIALGQIFNFYFGRLGLLFFALIISLACLKTAIGLITSCSTYFLAVIKKENYNKMVLTVTFLGFIVSNFGLNAIVELSIPILNFIYPLAIFHAFVAVFFKPLLTQQKRLHVLTFIVASVSIFDILIKYELVPHKFVSLYHKIIPLSNIGLAWLSFILLPWLIQKTRKSILIFVNK